MSNKDKFKVGQEIFLLPIGNNAPRHRESEIESRFVKSVGRKYLTVGKEDSHWYDIKFYLEDLRQVTNYSPGYKLYTSIAEYEEDKEYKRLYSEVSKFFRDSFTGYYGARPVMSIEEMREIHQVVSKIVDKNNK